MLTEEAASGPCGRFLFFLRSDTKMRLLGPKIVQQGLLKKEMREEKIVLLQLHHIKNNSSIGKCVFKLV